MQLVSTPTTVVSLNSSQVSWLKGSLRNEDDSSDLNCKEQQSRLVIQKLHVGIYRADHLFDFSLSAVIWREKLTFRVLRQRERQTLKFEIFVAFEAEPFTDDLV